MKKFSVILIVVLLVFTTSCCAFADGFSVGLNFGFRYTISNTSQFLSASVGLNAEYMIIPNLSLALKANYSFGKGISNINAQLFAKYQFSLGPANLGFQAGAIYDMLLGDSNRSSLFVAPGIFGNYQILSLDGKFPLYIFSPSFTTGTGFLKGFFYDATIGIGHHFNNLFVNAKGNIGNSNSFKLETLSTGSKHIADFTISIGADYLIGTP